MPVPKCCQQNAVSVSLPEYILGVWDKGTIWAPLSYSESNSAFPSFVSFYPQLAQTHPSVAKSKDLSIKQNPLGEKGTSYNLQRSE